MRLSQEIRLTSLNWNYARKCGSVGAAHIIITLKLSALSVKPTSLYASLSITSRTIIYLLVLLVSYCVLGISSELLTYNMTATASGIFQTCNIGILGRNSSFPSCIQQKGFSRMSTGLIIEQIHCN